MATIGFLTLVGLPYTKFLWAPLMDRFEPPWLGRSRGWLVLTQLGLAGALCWMAATPPAGAIEAFALLAGLVAFVSAPQDVASARGHRLGQHDRRVVRFNVGRDIRPPLSSAALEALILLHIQ